MKREFLREQGLTDEQIDKIMAEHGRTVQAEQASRENEIATLKKQIAENEKLIKQFEKDNKDSSELKEKVAQLTADLEKTKKDAEEAMKQTKIDNAINLALSGSGTKYADLLSGKFDREKITINDKGEVLGVSEQVEQFKKDYADLFTPLVEGRTPESGSTEPAGSGNGYDSLLKNADRMTAEEIAQEFSKLDK